ncbi:sugar kinase [Streptomyces sp. NPDC091377]|uniref:sugar kinase n=1 Tax=Streptomyces sp. NPDC091377 TaxID=3365995 RepID=UPI0038017F59
MTVTGPTPDVVDVVALGESMVTFLPSTPGRLADVSSFERGIGGAESNLACVTAAAGHSTRWISRVGADPFGDHLIEAIGGYGVDTSAVRRDPHRPTGIYFRTAGDRATDAHEVAYYRTGSAASAMSVDTMDRAALRAGRILHLSGITAALSEDCRELLRELTAPHPGRPLVSFDVNYRSRLWTAAREDSTDSGGDGSAVSGSSRRDGSGVLLELARGADIVFVGLDEAEEAWGVTGGPERIRELLPEPDVVVVKDGGKGATAFVRGDDRPQGSGVGHQPSGTREGDRPSGTRGDRRPPVTFVPAPQVTVTAAVGAGDAFAAGFLSATLRGLSVRDRLRHGHLMAAAALTVPGDLAVPPARDRADRLVALDDEAWGRLRLGPGWTHAADRAEEEVRTP